MKRTRRLLTAGFCLLFVAGCGDNPDVFDPEKHDKVDPRLSLSRDDYRAMHDPETYQDPNNPGKMYNPAEPPVPELAEILAAPQPPKIAASKLVSVAVTDDVPLKDVLIELARLADVDIEVDAGITGGVSFRAKDRPFNEVVERIADLAGLRYTMKNGVLRVERDTPYVETYSLDFLNITRSSTSSTSLSTNVLSGGAGEGGGDGLSSGSNTTLDISSESDFWEQLEAGLEAIMSYVPPSRISTTSVAAQPLPVEYDEEGLPVPVSAPATVPAAADPSTSEGFFIVNRQAGTLTVSGTQSQHFMIQKYLEKISRNTSSQVLIEAKIVEVTLNDQFQSGIDWSRVGGSKVSLPLTFGGTSDPGNVATFSFATQDIGGWAFDLQAAVELTQTFGTTRTLSSPRLHAVNNQQAVMTFAENYVYFQLEIDRETNTATGGAVTDLTVTSTLNTVPIGIIMTLQPSINTDTDEVTLSVRPTLSRVTGTVTDPAAAFLLTQLP
ncbi:MAG: secretin N-terminal domain-containing protein, partial [Alphaproteobacteria bacterium]